MKNKVGTSTLKRELEARKSNNRKLSKEDIEFLDEHESGKISDLPDNLRKIIEQTFKDAEEIIKEETKKKHKK